MQNLDPSFSAKIIENSDGVNREDLIADSPADWVIFLDEDCYFSSKASLSQLKSELNSRADVAIWGGSYLSEKEAPYSTKAYNHLCNFWVFISREKHQTSNLLGGCLAVHPRRVRSLLEKNPIPWGGEDSYLLRSLQRKGVRTHFTPALNVVHAPKAQSFGKLKRRAFLHGFHREKYQLHTRTQSWLGWKYALIYFYYWPFWITHVLCLTWGSASQKLGRANRSQSAK